MREETKRGGRKEERKVGEENKIKKKSRREEKLEKGGRKKERKVEETKKNRK